MSQKPKYKQYICANHIYMYSIIYGRYCVNSARYSASFVVAKVVLGQRALA